MAKGMHFVRDGKDLMAYLFSCKWEEDSKRSPRPDLILLDLNMPRKDGRDALADIKAEPNLTDIPVVVLTASDAPQDIELCSRPGAEVFITKPMYMDEWSTVVKTVRSILSDPERMITLFNP